MALYLARCAMCDTTSRIDYPTDHNWCCSITCYEAFWAFKEASLFRYWPQRPIPFQPGTRDR